MAAKVLLGVVALTAIVGSPFAYNHFKSTSGETQKEEEKATDKQSAVNQPAPQPKNPSEQEPSRPQKPASEIPAKEATGKEIPGKVDNPSGSETRDDVCELGVRTDWDSTRGPLSRESQCVRKVILEQRGQQ